MRQLGPSIDGSGRHAASRAQAATLLVALLALAGFPGTVPAEEPSPNQAPTASDDSYVTFTNQTLRTANYTFGLIPYAFRDISATGTAVLESVDDSFAEVPIGFTLRFYSTDVTQAFVSSNGLITFGQGTSEFTGQNLNAQSPTANVPTIAVLWDDWVTYADAHDKVYYQTSGEVGQRTFVAQWHVVQHYSSSPGNVTFQAVLFEGTNRVEFHYQDTTSGDINDNGSSATVGLRDTGGNQNGRVSQYSHNQAIIVAPMALAFQPGGQSILANDVDPDSDPLSAVLVTGPSHGALTLDPSGSFSYTPETGFNGTDNFTYRANDTEAESGVANVTLVVQDSAQPAAEEPAPTTTPTPTPTESPSPSPTPTETTTPTPTPEQAAPPSVAEIQILDAPAQATSLTAFGFEVRLVDEGGTLVPGANHSVNLTILSRPAGGVLAGTTSVPSGDGLAHFSGLRLNLAGEYVLRVNVSALGLANDTQPIPVVAGAAHHLGFVGVPTSLTSGATFGATVEVQDAAGNRVPSGTPTITLTKAPGSATGTLGGTLQAAASEGAAAFSSLVLTGAGTYRLRATAPDLAAGLSGAISVNPTELERVARVTVTAPVSTLGAGQSAQLAGHAFDAADQEIAGLTFTFGVDGSDGFAFVGSTGTLSALRPGTATVRARLPGHESPGLAITITPGPLAQLRVSPAAAANDGATAIDFRVTAFDALGNAVTLAEDVSWSVDGGAETPLAPTAVFTVPAGLASGSHGVRARLAGAVPLARTALVDVTTLVVAAGAREEITAGSTETEIDGITSTRLSAAVAEAGVGSTLGIAPPSDSGSAVETANVSLARAATNLAVVVDSQIGGLQAPPPEVDAADLARVLDELGTTDAPALFLSISAVEAGQDVTASDLNGLLENLTITFEIPASYFAAGGLDPSVLTVVSYSDAHEPAVLTPTFLGASGDGLAYRYSLTITEFSAFAMIGAALSSSAPAAAGSGGGSVTLHRAVSFSDEVLRRVDLTFGSSLSINLVRGSAAASPGDQPPAWASALPPGTRAFRYLDLNLGTPLALISTATFEFDIPAEGPGRGVLLQQIGGTWALAAALAPDGPGQYEARIATPCCTQYVIVWDDESPQLAPLLPGGALAGVVRLTATATDNLAVASIDWLVDGAAQPSAQQGVLELDTTDLADGIHHLRIVAMDVTGRLAISEAVIVVANGPSGHVLQQPASAAGVLPVQTVLGPVLGLVSFLAIGAAGMGVLGRRLKLSKARGRALPPDAGPMGLDDLPAAADAVAREPRDLPDQGPAAPTVAADAPHAVDALPMPSAESEPAAPSPFAAAEVPGGAEPSPEPSDATEPTAPPLLAAQPGAASPEAEESRPPPDPVPSQPPSEAGP